MAYTLIFFGSGQKMTHAPTQHQPYGDTLSIMHDLLPAAKVKEVVGPEGVFGLNANTYVAHGVMNILQQAVQGDTTINLTAHSRGSCEALLCTHEITRIQKAIRESGTIGITTEQLRKIISDSPNKGVAGGLKNMLNHALEADQDVSEWCEKILEININLQLIDPVPGRHMTHLVYWSDPRFTEAIPSVVNRSLVLYAEHERTCAFTPVVPSNFLNNNENTNIRADIVPGMHGTAGGHLFLHAGRSTPETWDPEKVKDAQLITLYRFIEEQLAVDPTIKDEMLKKIPYIRKTRGQEVANQLKQFLNAGGVQKKFLYVAAYERIQEYEAAYQVLAQGGYGGDKGGQLFMWHEIGPDRAILTKTAERRLLKESLGVDSAQYVNNHHAEIAGVVSHYNSLPLLTRLEVFLRVSETDAEKLEYATRIVKNIAFEDEMESDLQHSLPEVNEVFSQVMLKVNQDFKRICDGQHPKYYTVNELVKVFNNNKSAKVSEGLDWVNAAAGVQVLQSRVCNALQYANETPFSFDVAENFVSSQADLAVLQKRLECYLEEMHYLGLYKTLYPESEHIKYSGAYQRMREKVVAVKKQLEDFVPMHLQETKIDNAENVYQATESIERFQEVLTVFKTEDPEWAENLRLESNRLQVKFFYEHFQCLPPALHEKAKEIAIRLEKEDEVLYRKTQEILRKHMGDLDTAALGLNVSAYLFGLVRSLFQLLNYVGCDIAPPQPCIIKNMMEIKAAYKKNMDVVNAALENGLVDTAKGTPVELLENTILELEKLCEKITAEENKSSYFSEKWGWYSETTTELQSLCATLEPLKQKCQECLNQENSNACLIKKAPATYLAGKTRDAITRQIEHVERKLDFSVRTQA